MPSTLGPGGILVADPDALFGPGGILGVNSASGAVDPLLGGAPFTDPTGVAVAPGGNLLIADREALGGSGAIFQVNPNTGLTLLSFGGDFVSPTGIAVAPTGDIFVADPDTFGGAGAVFHIDASTGSQTPISVGGLFVDPTGIAVALTGDIFVTDPNALGGGGAVFLLKFDPGSGEFLQLPIGRGGDFVDPTGIAITLLGTNIFVTDPNAFDGTGGIIALELGLDLTAIDPEIGAAQRIVSQGGNFNDPQGIALDHFRLYVTDSDGLGQGRVLQVNPTTGAQAVVASGGLLVHPMGLTVIPKLGTLSTTFESAVPLDLSPGPGLQTALSDGVIDAPGPVDLFAVQVTEPGILVLDVTAQELGSLDARAALFGTEGFLLLGDLRRGGGGLLAASDDRASGNTDPLIQQGVLPGTYYIAVAAGGPGTSEGPYELKVTFQPVDLPEPPIGIPVGAKPVAIVKGDFNGDSSPDLATANQDGRSVSILLGQGDGTFEKQADIPDLGDAANLITGDFNDDGRLDLAVLNITANRLVTLIGVGDGSFELATAPLIKPPVLSDLLKPPVTILEGDFNRNGDDVDTARVHLEGFVEIQLGASSIPGEIQLPLKLGGTLIDIRDIFSTTDDVRVLANNTEGDRGQVVPFLEELDGDGILDLLVVSRAGQIVFRKGIRPGVFEAPRVINDDPDDPLARTIGILQTGANCQIAASTLNGHTVSLYTRDPETGDFRRTEISGSQVVGSGLAIGDLDDSGQQDLVVGDGILGTLTIFLDPSTDSARPPLILGGGFGVAEIRLDDVNEDGRLDIVYTNRVSGDVGIFVNDGLAAGEIGFQEESRYRGGTGLYSVFESNLTVVGNSLVPNAFSPLYFTVSNHQTTGLVTGQFAGNDNALDLVVVNLGSNTVALLEGKGSGQFVDPRLILASPVDTLPIVVVTADFDQQNGPDLAVLNQGTEEVAILLNDGNGAFSQPRYFTAGTSPTGLSVAYVDANGKPDLLVDNEFGDVLILFGHGDGTFEPPHPSGQSIPLAVTDLNGDGQDDFVLASESFDRVSVQFGGTAPAVFQGAQNGLFAPDAVKLIDLNGDLVKDLVVANSGANQVVVYLGQMVSGVLKFRSDAAGVQRFDVGTNPVGMTFANLNADALPDIIVANQGSNSLTFLTSAGSGVSWTLDNRVRSNTGLNSAPTSTILRDVRRADGSAGQDGILDILVSNSQSNTVGIIPGNGNGNFDLNPSAQIGVGINPTLLVSVTDGFVALNSGSGTLTQVNDQLQLVATVAVRGTNPSTALAGDFNGDGSIDLIVGSSDGLLELFLDDGGELLAEGIIDTALSPSAIALSVIEGSRVFYVTSEGVEQAFAFSLDQFVLPTEGTVADLSSNAVAIIAALVAGSNEISGADYFSAQGGEGLNFGELLFFSGEDGTTEGTGAGGDLASLAGVRAELGALLSRFVQQWYVTFGTGEGSGVQAIVAAVRSVLDAVEELPIAGLQPFAGWQAVITHLQLPAVGQQLVGALVKASQATLPTVQAAASAPSESSLLDAFFGSPWFEVESNEVDLPGEPLARLENEPAAAGAGLARWGEWVLERQREELLLAGLLAASVWRTQSERAPAPGRRPRAAAADLPY